MRAGILAAGLGERLRAGGVDAPKALVRVAGRPLLAHALAAVTAAGADEIVVHVNDRDGDVVTAWLAGSAGALPVRCLRRTTASSLETFARLAPELLAGGETHALVAMVDGVFPREGLVKFARAVARIRSGAEAGCEGLIGVTRRPDDDRPLRVRTGADARVLAIGPAADGSPLSTAGLYLLPRRAILRGPELLAAGGSALRELLAGVVEEGVALAACDLGEVVDVDRPDDLEAAEAVAR